MLRLEFAKTIVIFQISTLKFIKIPSFKQKKETLNLGLKHLRYYLFFAKQITREIQNQNMVPVCFDVKSVSFAKRNSCETSKPLQSRKLVQAKILRRNCREVSLQYNVLLLMGNNM